MRRIVVGITLGMVLCSSRPSMAQETDVSAAVEQQSPMPPRPGLLMPLYVGGVALQVFDVYSTLAPMRQGQTELNPLVHSLTLRPAIFIAVKGATTAWSIYTAERLWKTGHRREAVATLIITNGIMTTVALNNARILGSGR
jgi:hypothetical protein